MNGGHDLGGIHGLVRSTRDPRPLSRSFMRSGSGASLRWCGRRALWDAGRATCRAMPRTATPADYLRHSYYENWLAGLLKLLVERGLVTAEELATGQGNRPGADEVRRCVLKPADVPSIVCTACRRRCRPRVNLASK